MIYIIWMTANMFFTATVTGVCVDRWKITKRMAWLILLLFISWVACALAMYYW